MSGDEHLPFRGLEGRTLRGLAVSDDGETTLRLTLDDGERYVETEGDCCSSSWWADIVGAKSTYGGTIREVRTLEEVSVDDGRTRQEFDRVYGFELVTDKGTVSLAFRNSSNGWYGGWAYDVEGVPAVKWRDVDTNDWRA